MKKALVMLGRYGDICNGLAICDALEIDTMAVSKEYADIMEGQSFIQPLVLEHAYHEIPAAMKTVKEMGYEPILAQWYCSGTNLNLTPSYQTECWRLAGCLGKFNAKISVFDQRSTDRETALNKKLNPECKPMILIAGHGLSSPTHVLASMPQVLERKYPGHCIIDLSKHKFDRVYDVIGIMENSVMLVTIDTVFLHLAREAPRCPVIAYLNDGFMGSIPPPNTVCSVRYKDAASFDLFGSIDAILR